MRLIRKILQVVRRPLRIQRRLNVNHIPRPQLLRITIQIQLLDAGETLMDGENTMAAVIALSNRNLLWVEKHEKGVERGETGGISQRWTMQDLGENCFEASCVWAGEA